MPLILVTGPANAAKAGAVLARYRAALPREPLLVVPTSADVELFRYELAADGVVFGGEVVTFSRLIRLIAERTGAGSGSAPAGRPLGPVARERVVRAAVADVRLDDLAASGEAPGFAAAAGRLFSELQRSLVPAPRFAAALTAWGEASGRRDFAVEVAGLYSAYLRRLAALGRHDTEGFAWAALDALRARPASWPGRPVFLYGFDDLTPTELDAVETLSRAAGADVTVTLPYEPGRAALAGRAAAVEALRPLADEHVALGDRSEHYAVGARPALHHLERTLFEAGPRNMAPGERRPPNGAVRLLESGGERAEAELVGAAILELLDRGVPPEEIAVLYRSVGEAAPLVEPVLAAYGIPVASDRPVSLGRTRLGAGLLACARAALGDGTAEDVLSWLRTPGKLRRPELVDRLEARVRRTEAVDAAAARRLWEADRWPLAELDALAAARDDVPAFAALLDRELESTWTAPHRRAAEVLGPVERTDALVAAAVRGALGELRALHAVDPSLVPDAGAVVEALAGLEVRERTQEGDGVLLADPLAIRARRFRAVFVCGLQDGAFPRRPGPEPFLDDAERRDLARASGLVLPLHEDVADRERSLFYACVSRPEEVLYLSWRSSDEEGNPLQPSPFVAEVRDRFEPELWEERGRRLLADVTWPAKLAPTPLELRRAQASASAPAATERASGGLGAPSSDPVLALLAGRERESAGGLESFAACGVRWLVSTMMRPERIDPDPEPMRRGSLAHAVLERTLRGLRERTGSARLDPVTLPEAELELGVALRELGGTPAGARARATLRALELDLRRVLRVEAESGSALEPSRLEWGFGGERDEHPALELAGVRVSGRVDRIDAGGAGGRRALVRDYKNRAVHPGAKWAQDGRLQVALYALAAREYLGLDPVGAIYQPLAGKDLRPRGLVCDDAEGTAWVDNDVVDAEAFACALDEARAAAEHAAADLHAGRIVACPERCTPRGDCAYPTICRAAG